MRIDVEVVVRDVGTVVVVVEKPPEAEGLPPPPTENSATKPRINAAAGSPSTTRDLRTTIPFWTEMVSMCVPQYASSERTDEFSTGGTHEHSLSRPLSPGSGMVSLSGPSWTRSHPLPEVPCFQPKSSAGCGSVEAEIAFVSEC